MLNLNNYVLFSPIGSRDPIGGEHDGAMLHIVRKYRPRKVYLYYTPEMYKNKNNGRWIDLALKREFPEIEIEPIIESEINGILNPSDFDAFRETFVKEINRIIAENPKDEVLLNVTSGTPQMMATLCLISVTSSRPSKIIQVSSPEKKSNLNNKNNYDNFREEKFIEVLENNPDISGNTENRCTEPKISSFRHSLTKSQITKLIGMYDYEGASRLAEMEFKDTTLENLIDNLRLRFILKSDEARKKITRYKSVDLFPIENNKVMEKVEYLSMLKLKQRRGLITDLVIGLNPFVIELMYSYLTEYMNINMDRFNSVWSNGRVVVRRDKIAKIDPGLLNALDARLNNGFKDADVSILYLLESIKYFTSRNSNNLEEDIKFFEKLKKVNELRNRSAHNLVAITDKDIQKESILGNEETEGSVDSLTSQDIVSKLEQLMLKIFRNQVREEDFNLYDTINGFILDELDKY